MSTASLSVPSALHARMKARAAELGIGLSVATQRACLAFLGESPDGLAECPECRAEMAPADTRRACRFHRSNPPRRLWAKGA